MEQMDNFGKIQAPVIKTWQQTLYASAKAEILIRTLSDYSWEVNFYP
jgi:hypothetical protein